MDSPKISVVIPVFNVESYLEKCLHSVVNQTYKNLEIICVDDGSTDCSGDICERFAASDNRILVIHKPNGGLSSARNAALERCTGEYIGFVDSDDWLEANMYEYLLNMLCTSGADLASCGYYEESAGICRQVQNLMPVPENLIRTNEFLKYIYIRDQYRGVAGYVCTRLMKKAILDHCHLSFDEDVISGEDVIFMAHYFINSSTSIYTSVPFYHYVQRADSLSHDAHTQLKFLDMCRAYLRVIDLYEENHVDEMVLDYVKRFCVYHGLNLLKLAFQHKESEKIVPIKVIIYKYFDVYCRTNREYPERIKEAEELLRKADIPE